VTDITDDDLIKLKPVEKCTSYLKDPVNLGPKENWYQPRNTRCEGTYLNEANTAALRVVSLTSTFEDYGSSDRLRLGWALIDEPVEVRARAIRPNLPYRYRMDISLPAKRRSYAWSTGVLSRLGLREPDIGLSAYTHRPVGGTRRIVYLPLSVSPSLVRPASETYSVVIATLRPLSALAVTYGPADGDGKPIAGRLVLDHTAMGSGFHPVGRITLPKGQSPGLYYLGLTATEQPSGSQKPAPYTVEVLIDPKQP
jgi:hypothetical protein